MLTKTVAGSRPGYLVYLSDGYWRLFGRAWPAWLGGVLLGLANFALFAYAAPWSIYGGFRVAGNWLISPAVTPADKLVIPWQSTAFVLDVAIILGALVSCLLANSFRVRMPRRKIRLVDGFVGGLLMGVGAALAPGCNIGGLFSAMSALSLSGFVMLFALGVGAYSGVLIARWRLKRDIRSGTMAAVYEPSNLDLKSKAAPDRWRQPLVGASILVVSTLLMAMGLAGAQVGAYALFGLAFGFILQRSGFCFTASFRDMFTSGDGRLARGVIVAIAIATLGFAILVGTGLRKPFLLPVGWHTVVGGYLFGLGMVVAGGCATGTLFRIGEGSVQLLFAAFGGFLSTSLFSAFRSNLNLPPNGPNVWLVDSLGWQGAVFFALAFLAIWLLVVQWNEQRRRRSWA